MLSESLQREKITCSQYLNMFYLHLYCFNFDYTYLHVCKYILYFMSQFYIELAFVYWLFWLMHYNITYLIYFLVSIVFLGVVCLFILLSYSTVALLSVTSFHIRSTVSELFTLCICASRRFYFSFVTYLTHLFIGFFYLCNFMHYNF